MFDQVLEQSVLFKSQNVTPTSMISWVIHCGHLVSSRYDTVDCWYTSSILVQSETYSINGLNFLVCKCRAVSHIYIKLLQYMQSFPIISACFVLI